jgi:hypothetical protein
MDVIRKGNHKKMKGPRDGIEVLFHPSYGWVGKREEGEPSERRTETCSAGWETECPTPPHPPHRHSTSTCYRKLKSIGDREGRTDDKKENWQQIYNSLARNKKGRNREERIRRGKAPIFLHHMYPYQGCSKCVCADSIREDSY